MAVETREAIDLYRGRAGMLSMIKIGDIVLHTLSGNYYRCENKKMEKWMNMNPYYVLVPRDSVPDSYFKKD